MLTHFQPSFDGHSQFIKIEGGMGPICDGKTHSKVDVAGRIPTDAEWHEAKLLALRMWEDRR